MKTWFAGLLLLVFCVPTYAKSKSLDPVKGVYPVSCDDLWAAVKDTLGNKSNYALSSVNDLELHASFIVVGDLILYTDRVTLFPKEGGCTIKAEIGEVGAENTNWREFHKRLGKSLARLQAAKATGAPKSPDVSKAPGPGE
jgi:hypothetical protein